MVGLNDMKLKILRASILVADLLLASPWLSDVRAEDGRRLGGSRPYPSGLEVAFEWRYSCTNGRGCSFSCPGSGGASSVTELIIYLGAIPVGSTERSVGVFYEFSTMEIVRANGFAIATGLSTLSCQVRGMNLNYSGPTDLPTASIPGGK